MSPETETQRMRANKTQKISMAIQYEDEDPEYQDEKYQDDSNYTSGPGNNKSY